MITRQLRVSRPRPSGCPWWCLRAGRGFHRHAHRLGQRGVRPDLILFADVGRDKVLETYLYAPIIREWLRDVGFPEFEVVRYRPARAAYSRSSATAGRTRRFPAWPSAEELLDQVEAGAAGSASTAVASGIGSVGRWDTGEEAHRLRCRRRPSSVWRSGRRSAVRLLVSADGLGLDPRRLQAGNRWRRTAGAGEECLLLLSRIEEGRTRRIRGRRSPISTNCLLPWKTSTAAESTSAAIWVAPRASAARLPGGNTASGWGFCQPHHVLWKEEICTCP